MHGNLTLCTNGVKCEHDHSLSGFNSMQINEWAWGLFQ